MRIVSIIQARSGSSRLPDKIFARISGQPLLYHVVERIRASRNCDELIIATTEEQADDLVEDFAKAQNVRCFRGSTKNVLTRFYNAARDTDADIIARVTADDACKDPELLDHLIVELMERKYDYICNNQPPSYPEGLDLEAFTFQALEKTHREARLDYQREHVTPYMRENSDLFKTHNVANDRDLSHMRWTIDTSADLEFAREIYRHLYRKGKVFLMNDVLKLLERNPVVKDLMPKVERDWGLRISKENEANH